MKTAPFAWVVVLAISSCQQQYPNPNIQTTTHTTSATQPIQDSIIRTFIANKKGDTLFIEFNNRKASGIFNLNGARVALRQDTTGSGIRYSNATYLFEQWHHQTKYFQNGKLIFSNE